MMFLTTSILIHLTQPSWKSMISMTHLQLLTTLFLLANTTSFTLLTKNLMLDSISLALTSLTFMTIFLMLISSMKVKYFLSSSPSFLLMIYTLALLLTLTFNLNSLMKFFILFESTLIPTLILILTWGYQPERLQAGLFFIMYTLSSSLPLLLSIILIYTTTHSSSLIFMTMSPIKSLMSLCLILAFLVKLPIYALHLWLPKAHVEAPVAGSMILASVLLKLGSYGLIRMINHMPFLLTHSKPTKIMIASMAMVGASITAILCLRQHDLKELVAYASVSHMSLLSATLLLSTTPVINASMMMNMSHGLTSSLLFFLTNASYENSHSRSLFIIKSTLSLAPSLSLWWALAALANGAAPPYLNLLSEMLMFSSLISSAFFFMLPIFITAFFSMVYSILMFMNTNHGKPSNHLYLFQPMNYHTSAALLHISPLLMFIFLTPLILS